MSTYYQYNAGDTRTICRKNHPAGAVLGLLETPGRKGSNHYQRPRNVRLRVRATPRQGCEENRIIFLAAAFAPAGLNVGVVPSPSPRYLSRRSRSMRFLRCPRLNHTSI
jgi:hypothetical protein